MDMCYNYVHNDNVLGVTIRKINIVMSIRIYSQWSQHTNNTYWLCEANYVHNDSTVGVTISIECF